MSDGGLFIATYAFNGGTEPFVITLPAGCARKAYFGYAIPLTDGSCDFAGCAFYENQATGRHFSLRTIVNAEDAELMDTGDGMVVATPVAPVLREVRLLSKHAGTYELVGDHIDSQFRGFPVELTTRHVYTEAIEE